MKRITFQRDALRDATSRLSPILSARKDVALASHARIKAESGVAALEATDLETWGRLVVACEAAEDGAECIVPGKLLADLVDRISADTVTLEIDGTEVTVRGGRGRFPLEALPDGDWPSPPQADGEEAKTFTVPGAELRRIMGVSFARDDPKSQKMPALKGVWLHRGESGTLAAVALDGRRLALRESPAEAEGFSGALIDAAGWDKAARLLGDAGEVRVSTSFSYIHLESDHSRALVRLIGVEYPNFGMMLGHAPTSTARVSRSALLAAARLVEVVNTLPENPVVLRFEGERVSLRTMANSGFGEQEAPLLESSGDPFRVAFNSSQLTQLLGEIPGDQVEIRYVEKDKRSYPVYFHGSDAGTYALTTLSLDALPKEL